MTYTTNPNNITKQKLIEIIQSLPDSMIVDVSHRVPEPNEVEYLMGYSGRKTSIVSTVSNKCEMNISIEYRTLEELAQGDPTRSPIGL